MRDRCVGQPLRAAKAPDQHHECRTRQQQAEPERQETRPGRVAGPRRQRPRFRHDDNTEQEQQDSGIGVLVIVSALMLIAGATFAGADWASGSMSNQLLFEPPSPSRASRWRTDMSPENRRAFEEVAGPLLKKLGYEVES